jgi:hypothetical protein
MARADLINRLYSANRTPLEFKFQSLVAPPLLSLLSAYDIQQLNDLARDPKLSAKLNKKLDYIKAILEPRGFIKFHSGTNRVVYRFLEDQSFLIKIALDKTGLSDNPMEYQNQFLLAPFITKVFESTPCGTVGLFERVEPITSRQEFISIAEDVFDLLNDKIIGEYVLEDIGTDYFMNWGIRRGFGPVLLDFPYCYKLDGNKLYCNSIDPAIGIPCGGAIDYDMGFNNLVCTKCGNKVFARDLQADINKQKVVLRGRKEHSTMKVQILIPGQEPVMSDTTLSSKTYVEQVKKKKSEMRVEIINNRQPQAIQPKVEEVKTETVDNSDEEIKKLMSIAAEGKRTLEEEKEKESKRNSAKHVYVPQQSAPFARPKSVVEDYVNMNKDDEDEQAATKENKNAYQPYQHPEKDGVPYEKKDEEAPKLVHSAKSVNKPRTTSTVRGKSTDTPIGSAPPVNPVRNYSEEAQALIPDMDNGRYPAAKKNKKK